MADTIFGRDATLLLAFAFAIAAAKAEASSPSDARTDLEEITVTGSLIRRDQAHGPPGPVTTIRAERFDLSGAMQPADILRDLTINTGSTLVNEQNSLQGTAQFSLRALGLSSTLTLINGRRAGLSPVSPAAGHAFFDINTLPVSMIERIDVLKDGASSTYGSQAVAGVVNIVTRKGFDGFEVAVGHREATNVASDVGFAFGRSAGNASFGLYGAYYRHNENFRSEFDWLAGRIYDPDGDGNILDGRMDTSRGSPGSFRKAMESGEGVFLPATTTQDGETRLAPQYLDPGCAAAGGIPNPRGTEEGGLRPGRCHADFFDQRTIIAAEERIQFFLESEYDLSDDASVFVEAGFSRNEITDRVGNLLLFQGNVQGTNGFFVPASHPFNFFTDEDDDGRLEYVSPSAWNESHQAVDLSYFGRPLGVEANGASAGEEVREFDSHRILAGLTAEIGPRWHASGHVGYTENTLELRSQRHWVAAEFARAIREGAWNPFATRLTDPDLATPKTPAQLGGAGNLVGAKAGNDARALSRFSAIKRERAEMKQTVAEVTADGELLALGEWGVMDAAFGSQYRRLEYDQTPDPLNAAGLGPQEGKDFPKSASQQSWAVFGEALAPVGHWAELQFAARYEKYDKAGSTTDPKISLRVFAADWLEFRGSYGTSFQAPSVFQTAGNVTAKTLTDPFEDGTCVVQDGRIVSDGGNFITVLDLKGGSLKPQSAESRHLGFVVRPTSAIRLSLDYWNYDYKDVVAQEQGFQDILNQDCLGDRRQNDPRVKRDSSGQLSRVDSRYVNVAAVKTAGYDVETLYRLGTGSGEIEFSASASRITRFDVMTGVGSRFTSQLGNRNSRNGFGPTPELRFNAGLTWRFGDTTANATFRYIDDYRNDESGGNARIKSWSTVDVHLSHSFRNLFGRGDETTFSLGANNLFDRNPPCLSTGPNCNQRPGYDGRVHDIRGRIVYVRLKTDFGL